uniref:Uncharacterized protein n=1 Tax=uncultured marine microorganism HF4000_APKG10F17 TaxID=455558 RepID=B3TC22_9ZZZZ|nr:hypothetical protein ALOHA_HF4000APKG10F17ctg1g31 [uncultured marine microorganism HF4000_APKG10F17]
MIAPIASRLKSIQRPASALTPSCWRRRKPQAFRCCNPDVRPDQRFIYFTVIGVATATAK